MLLAFELIPGLAISRNNPQCGLQLLSQLHGPKSRHEGCGTIWQYPSAAKEQIVLDIGALQYICRVPTCTTSLCVQNSLFHISPRPSFKHGNHQVLSALSLAKMHWIPSLLFILLTLAGLSAADCESYGYDFVDGGTYCINTTSADYFSFGTLFYGKYADGQV